MRPRSQRSRPTSVAGTALVGYDGRPGWLRLWSQRAGAALFGCCRWTTARKVAPSDVKSVANGGWGGRVGAPTLRLEPGRNPALGSRISYANVPARRIQPVR